MPKKIYTQTIAKLLKSGRRIFVNQQLLTAVGADDYRDFAIMLGTWSETKDFTYQANIYDPAERATWQRFLRAFLKDIIAE